MTNNANGSTPETTQTAPLLLAGKAELRALLGQISRKHVQDLILRSDFPKPASKLARGNVWNLEEVKAWINEHGEAAADIPKQARRPYRAQD